MKYRCTVDVSFNDEDDSVAFMNLMQEIKDRAYKGTKYKPPVKDPQGNIVEPAVFGDGIPVVLLCESHECFHDENPSKQCGSYVTYDLKKVDKDEVKNKSGKKIAAGDLLKPKGV